MVRLSAGEVSMTPRYDLFKIDDGSPVWFGAAETMRDVKVKVQQASIGSDIECVVLDQVTGHKSVFTPEQIGRR
jgi:hypothetical protein